MLCYQSPCSEEEKEMKRNKIIHSFIHSFNTMHVLSAWYIYLVYFHFNLYSSTFIGYMDFTS